MNEAIIISVVAWTDNGDGNYILNKEVSVFINESISALPPGSVGIMIVIFPKYRHNNGIERRNECNDSFGSIFTFRFAVTPTLNEIFSNFQSVTSNQVKNKISSVASNACMLLQKVYLPIISKMKGSSIDKLLQSLHLTNQILNSSEQSFRNVQLALPSSLTYKLTQSGTVHYNIDYNSQHLLERRVLLLENEQDISSMILELSVIPSVVRQSELYLQLIMNKLKHVLSLLTEIRWRTVTSPSNENIKLTGPDAEIEFWRNVNVKLSTWLKTVSHPRHKTKIYLLRAAISSNKLLEWFNCGKRLVSNLCEAQENFKYLLSLLKIRYYSTSFRVNEIVENINLKNGLSHFHLNFDPFIECEAHTTGKLLDMNISCPSICVKILNNLSNLEANAYRLRHIVRIYNDIQIRSSERTYRDVITKLFCEYPSKLHSLLQEGKIICNWQSPGLTKYTEQCELQVDMMENLVYRVEWLVANRIHRHLDTLFNISLMTIPNVTSKTHMSNYNGQPLNEKHQCITLEEFAQLTKKDTLTAAVCIAGLNSKIKNAVLDLIEMFTEACDDQAGSITFQPCHGSTVKLGRLGKLQQTIVQTFALTDKGLRKIHQLRSIPTSQQTIEDSENKSNEDGKQLQENNVESARVWNYYKGRMNEGLIYITINSIDKLREHLLSRKRVQLNKVEKCKTALYVQSSDALNDEHVQTSVLCVEVILDDQIIKLSSSLDKLQHSVNQVVQYILNVSKGVKRCGQSKKLKADTIHCIDYPGRLDSMRGDIDVFQLILKKLSTLDCKFVPENSKSTDVYNLFELPRAVLYNDIRTDVKVSRIYKDLSNCIVMNKEIFESSLQYLYKYSSIWQSDETISDKIVAIKREDFGIMSILNGLSELDNMVKYVQQIEDYHNVFQLKLTMTPFKISIVQQVVNRKLKACEHVQQLLIENAPSIHVFMQRLIKELDKELHSVEDFKTVLSAIDAIRSSQHKIERSCMKLRTAFNAIAYHYQEEQQISRPFTITDKSEELARSYEELIAKDELAQYYILKSRSMFVNDLLNDIEVSNSELNEFDNQYQTTGPMIEGVAAKETSDIIILSSSKFDLLWHRHRSLYEGEQLFNLPHRKFNRLYFLKKELNNFNRLYALFDKTNKTIDQFKDTVWSKINISLMTDKILDLMSRCKRMPTILKKWPAYRELPELIAEFIEKIPHLEMLSNKAMQIRHWQNMESIFNIPLNVSDDAFQVGQLVGIPMIEKKEQIEDVCIRAMEEQEIEVKLNSLESEWRKRKFKLAHFKIKVDIILNGQDTSKAISAIGDSNLILTSLASNWYNEHSKVDNQKCIDGLAITYEVTTKWIQVQNLWVYLEAVFIEGDISRQLPLEARKFNAVDKMWLKMITKVKETPEHIVMLYILR
ncbi:hypothetical protein GJ496_003200 [Pomphorhynchus laevis]|nr:hypothetical protein GJ496_003200 [Pomphorhynchus laevis]